MLDWTGIAGLQEGVTRVATTAPVGVNKGSTFLSSMMNQFGIDAKSFNLGREVMPYVGNDTTWVDRMVDRFTSYLDFKFEEVKAWFSQQLMELGQGTLMFVIAGGQLVCIIYIVGLCYKMLLNTKHDEDYVTKGILAGGGYLVLKCAEVALFTA